VKRPLIDRMWGPRGARLILGDAAVLGILAAGIFALIMPGAARGLPARAEVEVSGKAAAVLDLSHEGVSEITGPLGLTRLEVRGGHVRILSSPCPRQSCRHGGWIGSAGEMLVCLPNEVVVRLPGRLPGAPDALSR
jgi:hypothetical protein